jgi:ribose transport system ATP-binding protein
MESTYPLLLMSSIQKTFPGVHAVSDVSLKLSPGEVLALVGENGAGKSTLVKILSGAHKADSGEIYLNNVRLTIDSPADSCHVGISIIYQEFNLVPYLTVTENVFLGREKTKFGFPNTSNEVRQTRELFQLLGVEIDPHAYCSELSIAQQQLVEIAKALSLNSKVLIMDEPSAVLTDQEVHRLFGIIRSLKNKGVGIIYISHRLEEIFEIADSVMVMRDGRTVGYKSIDQVNRKSLIEMMVGRNIESEFPKRRSTVGKERLRVENLSSEKVKNVSFSVRSGEIVGFAGLVGSGRTETMRLIFGADPKKDGKVILANRILDIKSPLDAIEEGICLLPENRKEQGLVLEHTVRENFALPNLLSLSKMGFINLGLEKTRFNDYVQSMRIKIPHDLVAAKSLSGGNQQKVVLSKWLETSSDVIIFDEPTRGIDVVAKYEIYLLMQDLAAKGKAIIMVSSELPEILGISDRIIVMHEGRIIGEIEDATKATQEEVMHLAITSRSVYET